MYRGSCMPTDGSLISKTDKQPLVFVIMPCFNSEQYIGRAIESVISQTYSNWQLLVIDDGSTDESVSVVRSFAEKDLRVHIIVNEKNFGTAKTRNRGFDLFRGDYAALLDSDDIWLPEKLEKQVRLAEKSRADIIYCSYRMIDENGNRLWDDFIVPTVTDFNYMLSSSVISCSTALLSGNIVERYRFPETLYHEDYAFWMMLLRDGAKACGVQEVLAEYRIRAGSRASDKWKVAQGRWHIYRKVLKLPLWKSGEVFIRYMCNGLHKYRKQVRK